MTHIYQMRRTAFYVLLIIIIISCSSKRFVTKALKYDEAGMFQEAAALYLRSLIANTDNMDARMGLLRTGNMVLEEKLNNFSTFHRNNQHKEAVYAFHDAERYYKEVASVGVKLDFHEKYNVYYNESRDNYISHLYSEGTKALNIEAFNSAEPLFSEIISIDASYKDSRALWVKAKYEPIYREGYGMLQNGYYRKAYYIFDRILRDVGTYKESVSLKDQSLKGAIITIGILPFYVQEMSFKTTSDELRAKTINAVHQIKSPFYKLIHDPVINSISQTNRVKDHNTAMALIQENLSNISVQSVLYAKIIKYGEYTSPVSKAEKPCYIKKVAEVTNEQGQKESRNEYQKTSYLEYKQHSKAFITVEFSLVNLKSGEILVNDVFTLEESDNIDFAEYKGNFKELVPGEWKNLNQKEESDKVFDDIRNVNLLQQKFSAKKEIRSGKELTGLIIQNASGRIAAKIEQYNPEK